MVKRMWRMAAGSEAGVLVAGVLGLALGGALGGVAGGQAVSAVPQLDLNRYTDVWYEVAGYPNKAEKTCASDAIVLYAPADKARRFLVVNSCRTKEGNTHVRNGNGKTTDKSGDGRLKVSYTWPFYTKEWVLAVGPEYGWALVGSPNHKLLWVLSKTAAVTPEVMAEIKGRAAAQGFDVGKLVTMPQEK